jgi:diguanylate cyclase (GGDEF)-like protein
MPSGQSSSVRELIERGGLVAHFQPIAQLRDGAIFGQEALIRTPAGAPWSTPDMLFAAARRESVSIELEIECLRLALQAWSGSGCCGRLFVNLSASALVTAMAQRDLERIMTVGRRASVAPEGVVVELTEHEHVLDFDALAAAVRRLRRHQVKLALDDFGDGRSSLRLWSELKPEIVKIDKYFCRGLPQHPEKLQTLRALQQISQTLGASLVVEGVETEAELHLVRDLGVPYGQGWMLGRPQATPLCQVPPQALEVIRSRDVAVFPERRRLAQQRATASALMRELPSVPSSTFNEVLVERFTAEPSLPAIAIVDDGRPLGLVGRQSFVDRYAKPYFRELYGRKPCTLFANLSPHIVDIEAGIDELTAVLTSDDQRYLSEGILITEAGRYRGAATGEDLVRAVTESRIEAARHANPLTLLPGNIPITQHIGRLLEAGREFVACYADLNHFKPYNDLYGYWRGDEMILLLARCITQHADARRDFVGHVGGDDFVVLFQSDDWERRCEAIVAEFNVAAATLYDESARRDGSVMAEDRHGVVRHHPLATLAIGAVPIAGTACRPEDVASAAAVAKRQAKASGVGVYLLSWADRVP